ncbi:MAG: hypothetical protein RH946_10020 [Rhodospirillales bacterium]
MARWKLAIVGLAYLPMLGACHTDPFSIKPETNATVPEKAPAEAAPAEQLDGTDAGNDAQ